MKRERKFMTLDIWQTILRDYVVPYKSLNAHLNPPTLIPHKDGEPLLNKQLPTFLKLASEAAPDIHIDVYTHGLLLKQEFVDFLGTLPNRCRLLVSFHFHNHDGTTNDYTQTTAVLRAALPTWPRNVELILASHLVQPMTRERLEEWKASWADVERAGKATVHANTSINPWTGLIDDPNCSRFTGCPYERFDHIFFGATGNIVACCMDLEEEIVFGNVMKDDPAAMVEAVRQFYARHWGKDRPHDLCRDCYGLPAVDRSVLQLGGVR